MSTNVIYNISRAPSSGLLKKQFGNLVSYAVLAPSGHNSQPWLFRLEGDHLDLVADRTRGLPVVDPHDRELTISCGAALDHLQTASRHYGRDLDIEVCPDKDPDLLARVRFGEEVTPTEVDQNAFNAIPHRRTTRVKFDDRVLSEDLSAQCQKQAELCGIELRLITDQSIRSGVAELVAEGDRLQFSDHRFRRELASWVHSRRRVSKDGMSGTAFGMPDVLSPAGGLVIRTFDIGKGVAAGDYKKITQGSPTLAVFSSPDDSVPNWLATGQALSKVILMLNDAGVTSSYLNPPVELEELRPRLKNMVGCEGLPQLLMRFGYGPKMEASVRRDVSDVLV